MNHRLFRSLTKSIKEAGKIKRGEIQASRLYMFIDATMQHEAYMAHHRGFIQPPWWKHWWIHFKLWRARRRDKKTNKRPKIQ